LSGVGFCAARRSQGAETKRPLSALLYVLRANGPAADHRSDPVAVQETFGRGHRRPGGHDRCAQIQPNHQSHVVRGQHKGNNKPPRPNPVDLRVGRYRLSPTIAT